MEYVVSRVVLTMSRNVFESIRLGEYVRIFLSYPVIGLAFVVLSQLLPSMTALRKSFMIYSADKIQERKEHETGQQDFIGHVRERDIISTIETDMAGTSWQQDPSNDYFWRACAELPNSFYCWLRDDGNTSERCSMASP